MYARLKYNVLKTAESDIQNNVIMGLAESKRWNEDPFLDVTDILEECLKLLCLPETISETPDREKPAFSKALWNVAVCLYEIDKNINMQNEYSEDLNIDISEEFVNFQEYFSSKFQTLKDLMDSYYDGSSDSDSDFNLSNEKAVVLVVDKQINRNTDEI